MESCVQIFGLYCIYTYTRTPTPPQDSSVPVNAVKVSAQVVNGANTQVRRAPWSPGLIARTFVTVTCATEVYRPPDAASNKVLDLLVHTGHQLQT